MAAPYYAECYFVAEGRCFRLVHDPAGRADHCDEPVTWRGRFRTADGRSVRVWSCDGHAADLAVRMRVRCV